MENQGNNEPVRSCSPARWAVRRERWSRVDCARRRPAEAGGEATAGGSPAGSAVLDPRIRGYRETRVAGSTRAPTEESEDTTREASASGTPKNHPRAASTWSVFCFCTLLAAPTCCPPLDCSHGRDELARDVENARTSPGLPRPSSSSADAEERDLCSCSCGLSSIFPRARARVERESRVPRRVLPCHLVQSPLHVQLPPCDTRETLLPLTIVSPVVFPTVS